LISLLLVEVCVCVWVCGAPARACMISLVVSDKDEVDGFQVRSLVEPITRFDWSSHGCTTGPRTWKTKIRITHAIDYKIL